MDLIKNHLENHGIFRHHIESYNHFVLYSVPSILSNNSIVHSDIDPTFYLKLSNIQILKPTKHKDMIKSKLTPDQCRLSDLSYLGDILVDIEYEISGEKQFKEAIRIGAMPVMTGSLLCHTSPGDQDFIRWIDQEIESNYKETEKKNQFLDIDSQKQEKNKKDKSSITNSKAIIHKAINYAKSLLPSTTKDPLDQGGYFILKGIEKVILIQEQLSKNRIIANKTEATVSSVTNERKSRTTVIKKNNNFFVRNNIFTEDVPLIHLLKYYGVKDRDILDLNISITTLLNTPDLERLRKGNEQFMDAVLLPNVKKEVKGKYLLLMAQMVLSQNQENQESKQENLPGKGRNLKKSPPNDTDPVFDKLIMDLDFLGNKRYELSGTLLSLLFEDALKKFLDDLKKSIDKILSKRARAQNINPLHIISLNNTITNTLTRAIQTGTWRIGRFRMERAGCTTTLSRLSYLNYVNLMTRINSQFEKTRKISGPRSLHTSSYGMICPCDTPEGESCGLVKTLSCLAEITHDVDPYHKHINTRSKNINNDISKVQNNIDSTFINNNISQIKNSSIDSTLNSLKGLSESENKYSTPIGKKNVINQADRFYNRTDYTFNDASMSYLPTFLVVYRDFTLFEVICSLGLIPFNLALSNFLVFLNGEPIGTSEYDFTDIFRKKRRSGQIHPMVSVYRRQGQIHISSDGGRVCRPLLVNPFHNWKSNFERDQNNESVRKDKIDQTEKSNFRDFLESWKEKISTSTITSLLTQGMVEYLDVNELSTLFISPLSYSEIVEMGHTSFTEIFTNKMDKNLSENQDIKTIDIEKILCRNYTHLEISPQVLLSYSALTIPFPEHNQSPRNTYQCAMSKQTLGISSYDFKNVDYFNFYGQVPLTYTPIFKDMVSGQNMIIAVMSLTGYDIEDAIVLNKAAIDRGLARVSVFNDIRSEMTRYSDGTTDLLVEGLSNPDRKSKTEFNTNKIQKKMSNDFEEDKKETLQNDSQPVAVENNFSCNTGSSSDQYKNISQSSVSRNEHSIPKTNLSSDNIPKTSNTNEKLKFSPQHLYYNDGIVSPGDIVTDHILINKKSPSGLFTGSINKSYEPLTVQSVLRTNNLIKIRLRTSRRPIVGDKFSSRHGQKGVVGRIINFTDMPFRAEDGLIPDLIMNPHGFPSRMTVGKIKEMVVGQLGIHLAKRMECTAFSYNMINSDLKKSGIIDPKKRIQDIPDNNNALDSKYSNDNFILSSLDDYKNVLYSFGFTTTKSLFIHGQTGKAIESLIFCAPVYYQRLKHMVTDKIHARSIGKKTVLTRQPTEGRSREGGLRVGEMERDCFVSYGVSQILRERLMWSSDHTQIKICGKCGSIFCKNRKVALDLPYAYKLLIVELMAMGIKVKMRLSPDA